MSHDRALLRRSSARSLLRCAGSVIRVLVISSICLYREGLTTMLDRFDTIDVLGSAADVAEALGRCEAAERAPDVVLVDTISADAERRIRSIVCDLPGAHVLALTVPNRESDILALTEVGIDGFVTADASVDELVASIDSVARGEALCSPSVVAALMRRLADLSRERQPLARRAPLTTREWEILELIETGLSNKQIAVRLHIELATVKNHVHHILTKLGVNRRTEAAALVRSSALSLR